MWKFITGIILALAALWGGSYGLHVAEGSTYPAFPIFMTAVLIGIVGIWLAVTGVEEWGKKNREAADA